ncbi:MAG: glycine oxidase ThiO [Acidimicrobiia bacterium]|nr:glycine oxidase ThiO [Acidimicrobiia bacterium]
MRVAVVGAGVIGLSIAWRCAQRGMTVTVHDPEPTRAAAHVAAGMLAPVTELHYGEEALLALNLESARRWPSFAAELAEASGVDPGYLRCGTLTVARDLDDIAAIDALRTYQDELGLEVERLTSRELRRREPALATGVRGGLFVADDHQVESRRLLRALRSGVTRSGGQLVSSAPRSTEELDADVVVVAAGWCSPDLVPGLPVRPVKGQILRVAVTPTAVLPTHVLRGLDVYLAPRHGEVVIGATVEEVGPDTTVTAGAVADLLRAAWELVPGIAEAELVETAAGLRPGTPDNAPIIGAVDHRVVVATGHYRNGVLLAPVTADAVAELVDTGSVPHEVVPFGADRFAKEEAP